MLSWCIVLVLEIFESLNKCVQLRVAHYYNIHNTCIHDVYMRESVYPWTTTDNISQLKNSFLR